MVGRGQTEQALNDRKPLGSRSISNGKSVRLLIGSHLIKNALVSLNV